jgi:hypothetical protein
VAEGQHKALPAAPLLEALVALPRLANENDVYQVEGIMRLAQV